MEILKSKFAYPLTSFIIFITLVPYSLSDNQASTDAGTDLLDKEYGVRYANPCEGR